MKEHLMLHHSHLLLKLRIGGCSSCLNSCLLLFCFCFVVVSTALTHWQCVGWVELNSVCMCFYCGLFVFVYSVTVYNYLHKVLLIHWLLRVFMCVYVFVWAEMNASVWVCFDRCNEEIEQVKGKLSRIALTKRLITKQNNGWSAVSWEISSEQVMCFGCI